MQCPFILPRLREQMRYLPYFKCLVCSIFFNENYHRPNSFHVMRRFSHSVTNRFAHSTTNYRYQFKFLRVMLQPNAGRAKASRNTATPISRSTLCSWVSLPIYCFPSTLLRKNRVETALNYTNPIEIRHPDSATSKLMPANTSVVFSYCSHNMNLDDSFLNYNYIL